MKTELYLKLRDIAISQGHLANIYNDELVIYFFQEPSFDINDSFRIHTRINDIEVSIYFSFNMDRFKISELGEEKLLNLFKVFETNTEFNGVIKMSHKADVNKYGLEYSFRKYLDKNEQTLTQEQLQQISSELNFEHKISSQLDCNIEDSTDILPFLNLTSAIRGLPDGKFVLFQKHFNEQQHIVFEDITDITHFLNDCYSKAASIKDDWERIIGNDFIHSFRLEGESFVFNQGYFSSIVNEQFISFTKNVLDSKDALLEFSKSIKCELDNFLFQHPELHFQEYISEVGIVPIKDSIAFQILKVEISFLNKKYLIELSFEPMMNGYVLKISNSSLIFNMNNITNMIEYIIEIKHHIRTFFDESYKEFDDAIEILQFVQNSPILDGDSSFISLVGPNLYRFRHMPTTISSASLISNEPSFITKSYCKSDFSLYLKSLIKLDHHIQKQLIPIIKFFNFSRPYERHQLFLALKQDLLVLVTPAGHFPFKFMLKNDRTLELKTMTKSFSYPLYQEAFLETVIKGIEAFEKQIILTYMFSSEPVVYDLLSSIFSRYSIDISVFYENSTSYNNDELLDMIESLIETFQFEDYSSREVKDIEQWKASIIGTFLERMNSIHLKVEYMNSINCFKISDPTK